MHKSNQLRYCPQGPRGKASSWYELFGFYACGPMSVDHEGAKYPLNESNYFLKSVCFLTNL